jgi:thymidylate synthase
MQIYLDLLQDILTSGIRMEDRTGTGTLSVTGRMMHIDLTKGFPLLTTKRVHFRSVVHELLWFLMGTDDTTYLETKGVTIWREWQVEKPTARGPYPSVGPMYGVNWLHFPTADYSYTINQIDTLIKGIRLRPGSRRHIISAWNPATLPDESKSPHLNVQMGRAALAPCHVMAQFFVRDGRLSCMMTQRSADAFLGLPFNIASYSLLTHMIAQQTDLDVGEFIWSGGDVHLYLNHLDQVREQLSRSVRDLPILEIGRRPASIYEYKAEDFTLHGYNPHPSIYAPVSV